MTTYLITLHGAGSGELDRRVVNTETDRDLVEAMVDFIRDVEILRDGDTIRIEEKT